MDSIDVSIGLIPTIQLLAQYHQNGVLQAKMSHLPVLHGVGVGVIEVIGGKIVSCFIQNEQGVRRSLALDKLTRFDESRGPFEWRFYTNNPQKSGASNSQTRKLIAFSARPLTGYDIPHVIAHLNVDVLTTLSLQQKRALRMTYAMINGRRTLAEIATITPLPKGAVHDAIVALIKMRMIVIYF